MQLLTFVKLRLPTLRSPATIYSKIFAKNECKMRSMARRMSIQNKSAKQTSQRCTARFLSRTRSFGNDVLVESCRCGNTPSTPPRSWKLLRRNFTEIPLAVNNDKKESHLWLKTNPNFQTCILTNFKTKTNSKGQTAKKKQINLLMKETKINELKNVEEEKKKKNTLQILSILKLVASLLTN